MPKIGRNDPCPCGSGKKYKHCCMLAEHAQQAENVIVRRDYEQLLDRLFAFAQTPSLVVDTKSAFHLFWNGDYPVSGARLLPTQDLYRFFDWYVFDYPLWEAKKRIVQIFHETAGPQLSAIERRLLADWQDVVMSVYRVEKVNVGSELLLIDLLQEGSYRVEDPALSRIATAGDLIVGHVLKTANIWRLSVAPALLPPTLEAGLLDSLDQVWQSYREAHYQATKMAFLRDSSHLFNHYLLQQAAAVGAQRPPAASKYYDISKAIETLEQARKEYTQERLERLQEKLTEEQGQEYVAPEPQAIAGGRLLLPGDSSVPPPRPEESHKTIAGGKLLLP